MNAHYGTRETGEGQILRTNPGLFYNLVCDLIFKKDRYLDFRVLRVVGAGQ